MFQTKKKKIANHLDSIPADRFTPFDHLLYDYLHGELNTRLAQMHISKLKYHIDWLDDYKCIEVDGVCNRFLSIYKSNQLNSPLHTMQMNPTITHPTH